MAKAARKGKIYVDYLRNARGATAIAPYSTRRREDATVSMPLHWSEVSEKIAPDHFNVQNAVERLKSLPEDPWTEMANVKQGITNQARRSLNPSGV
jgi:bifunctional non-homologous end joining protein LigD